MHGAWFGWKQGGRLVASALAASTSFYSLHNSRCSSSIPEGIWPPALFGEHGPGAVEYIIRGGAGQDIRADLNGLGPFRVVSQGNTGHAEDASFLLNTAGVGQNKLGTAFKLEEREKVNRLNQCDVSRRKGKMVHHFPRTRMDGINDRHM